MAAGASETLQLHLLKDNPSYREVNRASVAEQHKFWRAKTCIRTFRFAIASIRCKNFNGPTHDRIFLLRRGQKPPVGA
jgi:hypothetical protein